MLGLVNKDTCSLYKDVLSNRIFDMESYAEQKFMYDSSFEVQEIFKVVNFLTTLNIKRIDAEQVVAVMLRDILTHLVNEVFDYNVTMYCESVLVNELVKHGYSIYEKIDGIDNVLNEVLLNIASNLKNKMYVIGGGNLVIDTEGLILNDFPEIFIICRDITLIFINGSFRTNVSISAFTDKSYYG